MSLLTRSINLLKFNRLIKAAAKTLSTTCSPRECTDVPNTEQTIPPPVQLVKVDVHNNWLHREYTPFQSLIIVNTIRFPNGLLWVPPEDAPDDVYGRDNAKIDAPTTLENGIAKQAARLIVIRRKKMKKHKLRKLRKRMKYEWAKVRQRRELKKEKTFQAGLISQCKEAEAFDAAKYVQERLDKMHEIIIPKRWKGKQLPEFLIREKMGLLPKK